MAPRKKSLPDIEQNQKQLPEVDHTTKETPTTESTAKPMPDSKTKTKSLPAIRNPENTVIIGGRPIESTSAIAPRHFIVFWISIL